MKTLAWVLLIPSLTFAQSVYKCPDTEGRFTLQQTPCANGQQIVVSKSVNGQGSDASRLVEYSKKLDEERKRKEEEEIEFKKKAEDAKALEESKRHYGIKNGRSDRDRARDNLISLCYAYPKRGYCWDLDQFDKQQ